MLCNFSAHLSRRSRKGPGSTPMMELLKSGPQEKSQARVKVKCRERRQEEEVDSGVGGRLFKKKKKKKKGLRYSGCRKEDHGRLADANP